MPSNYNSDKELMKGIRTGDSRAYEYLYRRYAPRLLSYASTFVGSDDVAGDIIQDCFVNIWMRRAHLRDVSLSGLLFTMVRNRCLNHLKHSSLIPFDRLDTVSRGWESLYVLDLYGDADHAMLVDDLRHDIDTALAGLPERTRQIFQLSRIEGLETREIAARLAISMTSVENHINKALARLSERFQKN